MRFLLVFRRRIVKIFKYLLTDNSIKIGSFSRMKRKGKKKKRRRGAK